MNGLLPFIKRAPPINAVFPRPASHPLSARERWALTRLGCHVLHSQVCVRGSATGGHHRGAVALASGLRLSRKCRFCLSPSPAALAPFVEVWPLGTQRGIPAVPGIEPGVVVVDV